MKEETIMGMYFYGYVEWKDENGKWHLLNRIDDPSKPATYVVQGHLRDLLGCNNLGLPVGMRKDTTYTPPPPRKEYGLVFTNPDRMLVDDELSDEITDMINKEYNPELVEEGDWMSTHRYYKITIGDLISAADEERDNALKHIKDNINESAKKEICKRLDNIEMFMSLISEGKSMRAFKNIGAVPEEGGEEEGDEYEESISYYEDEVLKYDIYALQAAAGFLGGIAETLGDFGTDSDRVRFIACLD